MREIYYCLTSKNSDRTEDDIHYFCHGQVVKVYEHANFGYSSAVVFRDIVYMKFRICLLGVIEKGEHYDVK